MWDLIVSVPDHCLSFYFSTLNTDPNVWIQFFNIVRAINVTKVMHYWNRKYI